MRRIVLESFLLADYNKGIKSLSKTSFLIVQVVLESMRHNCLHFLKELRMTN